MREVVPLAIVNAGRPTLDGTAGASPKRQVRLGRDLDARLQTLAAAEDREISELIREALIQYLDRFDELVDRQFDPLVYDTMRELGTQLRAQYVALAHEAANEGESKRWASLARRHWSAVRAVNPRSKKEIVAATALFREKLAALES